jgi:hypothetical protein
MHTRQIPSEGILIAIRICRQLTACSTVQLQHMRSFNWRPLIALCTWETCVIGSFLASLALTGAHIWGKDDLVWITWLAICGLFVVGVVALSSRRFGKLGGAIVGGGLGLLPSVLILTWVLVARPGFEASAGGAGFAYMLAAPSGVGGALAGIICSRRGKNVG